MCRAMQKIVFSFFCSYGGVKKYLEKHVLLLFLFFFFKIFFLLRRGTEFCCTDLHICVKYIIVIFANYAIDWSTVVMHMEHFLYSLHLYVLWWFPFRFASKVLLRIHEKRVHNLQSTQTLKCQQCHKTFSNLSALKKHERRHTGLCLLHSCFL